MSSRSLFFVSFLLLASLVSFCSAGTEPIEEGKEYQVSLNEDHFGDGLTKRSKAISEYVDFVTEYLEMRRFNTDYKLEIDLRSEGHFNIKNCGAPSNTKVRVRVWFEGPSAGLSSIDLKFNKDGATRSEAFKAPNGPSDAFLDQASQDVEEDVHACFRDYSRTTKIYFEPEGVQRPNITTRALAAEASKKTNDPLDYYPNALPNITTCADMRVLYPFALDPKMDDNLVLVEYEAKPTTYIYRLVGETPSGSEIVHTFTLEYDSPKDARKAKDMKSSEFSVTYDAKNGGFGGFDVAELEVIENMYKALLDKFGSPGDASCLEDEGNGVGVKDQVDNGALSSDSSSFFSFSSLSLVLLSFFFLL